MFTYSRERENDLLSIANTLFEISNNIKHLEENQKTLTTLVESKAEHSVEIRHLVSGMERVFNELKQIDTRVARVETILETQREKPSNKLVSSLFETMREYWHVAVILATAISFSLSCIFGIKVKD